jgi:hypothetical protein
MKQRYFSNNVRAAMMKTVTFILACSVVAGCANAQNKSTFTADDHTIMLLQPAANGAMIDAKSTFTPNVTGATTINDPQLGQVLQFGDEARNGISVPDGGKIDFYHGMTVEMQIELQQPDAKTPNPGGALFVKMGSFYSSIKDNRFNIDWMVFPSASVATTTDKQYKTYPVGGTSFPGSSILPANQWVQIALTYDPAMKVARSFIDGKLYWTEYFQREEAMPLLNSANSVFSFISGMKNVRVGQIRVSDVARAIDTLPPFETYVHALPYRKKSAVIIDHINPSELPVNVVLQSAGKQLQQISLTDPQRKVIVFDPPVSKGQYTLTIKSTFKGREVYSRNVDIFAGDETHDAVKIDGENRLVIDGKPIFPLMVYHTFIEDVPTLAKIGFSFFTPRYPNSPLMGLPTRDDKTIAIAQEYLDTAKANHIYMISGGGIFGAGGGSTEINTKGIEALTNDPALGLWYGADEPGRDRILQLQPGYTAAKQIGARPIFSVTNRSDHMQRLAETVDILGSDPYPIPNVSLRSVADFTKYCVDATAGLKPVWTVIPQYGSKRPTEQELRCMAYLAIASGAQGLGIYAWDDRNGVTKEGWRTGDYPEDLAILQTVIGELNQLQNVLIIPNSTRVLSLAPDNPAIHVAMKESGNARYLFVVNDSRAEEKATLSITGIQTADGVDVQDASQKLSIRDGKVLLQMQPLEVGIYKLTSQ